jgi:hypothetical protein
MIYGNRQPSAAEINAHLSTKLKRAVLHSSPSLKLRIIAARVGKKRDGVSPLEVQIMGYESHIDGGWSAVRPDTRIDLL